MSNKYRIQPEDFNSLAELDKLIENKGGYSQVHMAGEAYKKYLEITSKVEG